MKIVIPGGSGPVGSVLARAFVRDGHEVVVSSPAAATDAAFPARPEAACDLCRRERAGGGSESRA